MLFEFMKSFAIANFYYHDRSNDRDIKITTITVTFLKL